MVKSLHWTNDLAVYNPWIHLHTILFLVRHQHFCSHNLAMFEGPDRGHSWNPEHSFKMGITKPGPVLAFIEVHSWEKFLTDMCFQKGTLPDWTLWTALSSMQKLSNLVCFSLCLSVFSSLLHCNSISSICNTLGILSTSEKGSANSWKESRWGWKSANHWSNSSSYVGCQLSEAYSSPLNAVQSATRDMQWNDCFLQKAEFSTISALWRKLSHFHLLLWLLKLRMFSSCVMSTKNARSMTHLRSSNSGTSILPSSINLFTSALNSKKNLFRTFPWLSQPPSPYVDLICCWTTAGSAFSSSNFLCTSATNPFYLCPSYVGHYQW